MITHSRYTLAERYSLLDSFCVPDIPGRFEVRLNNERVNRHLLIVVHDGWRQADCREQIAPLIVIQYEVDGSRKCIEQIDSHVIPMNVRVFSRMIKKHAIDIFNDFLEQMTCSPLINTPRC
ncbi:hypothetical protein [Edwardsiella tarda]|uniref:hypothetical protein n=1 Tax=Edwardsiella tarda TaxID=636 RepID=UPI0034DD1403